ALFADPRNHARVTLRGDAALALPGVGVKAADLAAVA
ncbi:MAG: hypothetical protein HLUCCO18_18535, partial [Rhodobacteraceae bacterium HLUCCO18]